MEDSQMITTTSGGGTGSGLGSLILEHLSAEYGKMSKVPDDSRASRGGVRPIRGQRSWSLEGSFGSEILGLWMLSMWTWPYTRRCTSLLQFSKTSSRFRRRCSETFCVCQKLATCCKSLRVHLCGSPR